MTDATAGSPPQPFTIAVSEEKLAWINRRVQDALVIPDVEHHATDDAWVDGVPSNTINELVDYWKTTYDWRRVEKRLNDTYRMFTLDIQDGDEKIKLHFVHHRSEREDAVPLLFAHGWPGNFTEVENLLSLTSPSDPTEQAFHVIAPTIPGFTFSSSPKKTGFNVPRIGAVYHELMQRLGYKHYMAQGGDWGSAIVRSIAQAHPDACLAAHVNMIMALPPKPTEHPLTLAWIATRWFTEDEKKRMKRVLWWMNDESGYSKIQGTKPQTIGIALADSPVGMLAWIRDKLQQLIEPGYVWDKELVITWAMFYLLSESSWHARVYKESAIGGELREQVLNRTIGSEVAFGASCFPYDVGYVPRWWAETTVAENIVFWKEHTSAGHFPSIERPDLLKNDLWEFVGSLPAQTRRRLQGL